MFGLETPLRHSRVSPRGMQVERESMRCREHCNASALFWTRPVSLAQDDEVGDWRPGEAVLFQRFCGSQQCDRNT